MDLALAIDSKCLPFDVVNCTPIIEPINEIWGMQFKEIATFTWKLWKCIIGTARRSNSARHLRHQSSIDNFIFPQDRHNANPAKIILTSDFLHSLRASSMWPYRWVLDTAFIMGAPRSPFIGGAHVAALKAVLHIMFTGVHGRCGGRASFDGCSLETPPS